MSGAGETIFVVNQVNQENGSKVIQLDQYNFVEGTRRIDGHYWIEDDNGEIIYEETARSQHREVRAFKDALQDDPDSFLFYHHIDPILEQQIISDETKIQEKDWGGKEKHEMLLKQRNNGAFQCFTSSLRNQLLHGGNLRFGAIGIASPRDQDVYWLFGHPHNTEYEHWIVAKDPILEQQILIHDCCTMWRETPRIYDAYNKEVEAKRQDALLKQREKDRQDALRWNKKEALAKKQAEELLALLDREDKKVGAKKKPNRKKPAKAKK